MKIIFPAAPNFGSFMTFLVIFTISRLISLTIKPEITYLTMLHFFNYVVLVQYDQTCFYINSLIF